jgi:radical SAM superfamily enzyme YgiQ (UPF0313 family)
MIGDFKRKFHKKIILNVQVRSEIAENDQLLDAMIFAGVKNLAIGYESPVKEELLAMTKGVTPEKLIARSRKLSKQFYLHGMFIFGYPSFADSKHKSALTLDQRAKAYSAFFSKAKIDTVQVMNAIPLPGSLLREKLQAENRILPLEEFGYDKYDGMFLCYDPTPEGLDPYDLHELPKTLMKRWYLGNSVNKGINYGNWMNWTYTATIGFPIEFGIFYTKRLAHNLIESRREKSMIQPMTPVQNIFFDSLQNSWHNIQKRWRNLAVKTYAGGIVRGWMREYKKSDYVTRMKSHFSHRAPRASTRE